MSCRNPRLVVRIIPAKATPTPQNDKHFPAHACLLKISEFGPLGKVHPRSRWSEATTVSKFQRVIDAAKDREDTSGQACTPGGVNQTAGEGKTTR